MPITRTILAEIIILLCSVHCHHKLVSDIFLTITSCYGKDTTPQAYSSFFCSDTKYLILNSKPKTYTTEENPQPKININYSPHTSQVFQPPDEILLPLLLNTHLILYNYQIHQPSEKIFLLPLPTPPRIIQFILRYTHLQGQSSGLTNSNPYRQIFEVNV